MTVGNDQPLPGFLRSDSGLALWQNTKQRQAVISIEMGISFEVGRIDVGGSGVAHRGRELP
jgi:hypothetical protein